MFKGLWFFVKFGWKCEKRYIIYLVLNQFVNSLIPIVAVVMPRFIINELMGNKRIHYIALYVGILVGYTLLATIISNYLSWTAFTYRTKVSAEFNIFMHEKTVYVYKNFDGNGFEPSGGEGQKIALARALYKNAPIVVLDEPTAALDPRAEYDIYKRFNELVEGKTTIYISHRLSSTRFCDKVAVFACGKIIEYGSHNELLKRGGTYTQLFNMQAQFYK